MYYEEFRERLKIEAPSREVRPEEIDQFVGLAWLSNPLFLSDQGAKDGGHSSRLAPGLMVLSLGMGLMQQTGMFDHVMALLQFDNLKFHKPVYPGDTVSICATTLKKRPTGNPKRGLVVISYHITNQKQQVVLSAEATYLMLSQPMV